MCPILYILIYFLKQKKCLPTNSKYVCQFCMYILIFCLKQVLILNLITEVNNSTRGQIWLFRLDFTYQNLHICIHSYRNINGYSTSEDPWGPWVPMRTLHFWVPDIFTRKLRTSLRSYEYDMNTKVWYIGGWLDK